MCFVVSSKWFICYWPKVHTQLIFGDWLINSQGLCYCGNPYILESKSRVSFPCEAPRLDSRLNSHAWNFNRRRDATVSWLHFIASGGDLWLPSLAQREKIWRFATTLVKKHCTPTRRIYQPGPVLLKTMDPYSQRRQGERRLELETEYLILTQTQEMAMRWITSHRNRKETRSSS